MAYKFREEIVGKRFLSVSGFAKLKVNKISEWGWRAGVIRAASHRDNGCQDLQVLVEYDDVEWQRREWLSPHRDAVFSFFLVEKGLCWAERIDPRHNGLMPIEHYNHSNNNHHHRLNGKLLRGSANTADTVAWPAISFYPLVARAELHEDAMPVEFMQDRKLEFLDYSKLKPFADWDLTKGPMPWGSAVRRWAEMQDGQRILLTTPSILVGFRVEVYRAEGTTQWYTAVIVGYNEATKDLTVTDDTVLEDHNEDPGLVQMRLIGDGVVESIMRGEVVGMTPRRSRSSTGLMTHAIVVPRPGRRPRGRPGNNSQIQSSLSVQNSVSQQIEREKGTVRNNRRRRVSEGTPRDGSKVEIVGDEASPLSLRQEDRENKGPAPGRPGIRTPRSVLEETNNASGSGGVSKLRKRSGTSNLKQVNVETNPRRPVRNSNRRAGKPGHEAKTREDNYEELDNDDEAEDDEEEEQENRLSPKKLVVTNSEVGDEDEDEEEEVVEEENEDDNDGEEDSPQVSTQQNSRERTDPLAKRLKAAASTRRLRSDRKSICGINEEIVRVKTPTLSPTIANTEVEKDKEEVEKAATIKSRRESEESIEQEEEESESRERDREPEPPPPDKSDSGGVTIEKKSVIDFNAEGGSERLPDCTSVHEDSMVNGVSAIHDSLDINEDREKTRCDIPNSETRTLRLPAKDRRKEHKNYKGESVCLGVNTRQEDHPRTNKTSNEKNDTTRTIIDRDSDEAAEEEISRISRSVIEGGIKNCSSVDKTSPAIAAEAGVEVTEEVATSLVSRSPSIVIGRGGSSSVEFIEASSQDGSVLERLSPLSGGPGRQNLLFEEQERNRHNESPVILSERLNKPPPTQSATAVPTAHHPQNRYQHQQQQQQQPVHYIRHQQSASAQQQNHNPHNFHHQTLQQTLQQQQQQHHHHHHPHPNPHNHSHHLHHHNQRHSSSVSPHNPQQQQHQHRPTNTSPHVELNLSSSSPSSASSLNERRDSHLIHQTRGGDEASHLMQVEAGVVGRLLPGATSIVPGGGILGIPGPTSGNNASNVNTNSHHLHHQQQQQQQQQHQQQQSQPQHHPHQQQHVHQNLHHHQQHHSLSTSSGVLGSGLTTSGGSSRSASAAAVVAAATAAAAAAAAAATSGYGDSGSDSGVSSLRSAGSGDERSGSRSSALSAEEITTAVAPSSSSSSASSSNSTVAAVAAASATPARVWHVQSVQHTSLLMAHPQAHPAQIPAPSSTPSGSTGSSATTTTTTTLGYHSPASGGQSQQSQQQQHHHHSTTEILWRPPRYPPLPHGLLAPSQPNSEEMHERDRILRERREVEVREQEKRERDYEARMERDRLEKQRLAEQAVHKHFEVSLRLAEQKRNMQSASIPWNSFVPLPPPVSRSHGGPPPHGTLTGHGAPHHHPAGPGGATHPVTVVQQQQQQQQQHREREERDARDREREAQIREREQREREREHHAATERLHRQAEARDHAARDHAARAAYYAAAAPPTAQQVLRTSSMSGKVEYPPPPAHSRASKSSLTVTGHHEKAPPPPQVVGPPHSGLPKAEPNVSLFSYSNYQPQSSYMHEMKVKNDLQHKTSTGKVIDRDHHSREMLPNPPPLLPDHKSSVIVKNDGRDLQQKVQAPPHSSSPKMMSYLSVQSVTPSSIGVQQQQQQQQQQQHKNVAYEYRSPTQSPHLHHLDSLQAAKGMSPQVGHHGRMNSVPTQLPPSPHGHSTHPHNRQSPHGQPHPHQAPHPSPPEPRYLSRPEPGLPYAPAKSPYSYSHLPTSSPSSHYSAPPPGSKPKVSSPAPPHIYGKPNSGIMTGTPVCRASEPVVTAPLPLTSKTVGSSPYQQVPHHHGAPPPPLPPPAHSSRSVYDTRTYAGSLPTSKLPPPQLHGSPPSAASAPLSRPLVSHPSHHMSPHQPGQPIQHQQSSMNSSFQTQPLDLGVERTGSPKRKAHTPIDQPGQAVSLEICKKRRLEEPQPLSLQCVGPPVLSRVSEPTPLIASAATSITTVVNTALLSQPNTQNQDSRSWTSLSPAPRTDSGDGSIRPASTGSVSSLNPMTNATPSTAPSPAPISSPAPTTAAPSPAPSAPGTPAKVNPTTTDSEKSNSPAPRPPSTTNYPVHKLKKAWLQRHSGEDGTEDTTGVVGSGSCVMLPLKIAQAPSQPLNNKELEANSTATGSTTTTTSTNVTAATTTTTSNTGSTTITATTNSLPSAVNSIHNIGSMAVNSINRSKVTGKNARKSIVNKDTLNGHANDAKSNVQEDSSSSDPDRKSPPKRKPPKVKRKKGAVRRQQAAVEEQRRRKEEKQVGSTGGGAPSDSSNDSEAGSGSDASEQLTSSTQSASRVRNANTNSNNSPGNGNSKEPRKRGRRPKTSKGKEAGDEEQQPRQKKERRDDNTGNSGGSGNGGNGTGGSGGGGATGQGDNDGVAKPTIAQLKKSGASWLQDDACVMISRIARCRECMGASGASLPHTFCRFYQFRRLRYSKSGVATVAGFSDPHTDIGESDLSLWLPGKEHQGQKTGDKSEKNDKDSKDSASERSDMDLEMAHILLRQVGDQFCDLLNQETDALARHIVEARSTGLVEDTVAWKRVIKGVRELCDVCETTLFNIHWACGRCGFVVCIDCYQGRKNGTIKIWGEFAKDRDDFSWIVCKNRQAHDPERLMLTQIIPGDTLVRIGDRLHECRSEWGIPQHCGCRLAKPSSPNEILRKLISGDSVMVPNGNVTHEGKDQDKKSNDSNGSPDEKTNGEDKNSPLNWLADVALQNQEKNESNSSSDSDEDRDGNYSTLRELLIRPSHKPNGTGSRSNSPTNNSTATNPSANSTSGNSTQNNSVRVGKKSKMDTLDEVISSVIEHSVKKERDGSMENDEKPRELKHFVRRYKWAQRGREPLPIRIMTLTESKGLYPDVPHSWLCDGKLLKLNDPNNPNNYRIFQDQWKRGQPVIVSDVSKSLDMELWHPDSFARDFGNDKNDFINCMTGNLVPNQPMRKFWEGFEHFSKRLKDDRGNPMLLKLKDWPPGDDFSELLPSRFADLMKALPLSEYTHRNGRLNLVSRLPERCVRPDLGPKMYTAYGSALYPKKGTTNLHLDISDAVNVMVYVGIPKDGDNDEHVKEALRAIDEAGCDILTRRRVRERGEAPGALWHIYAARDADKIRDLLNAVALERGARLEPHHDPIHDQSCYLDGTLRERLYREYGVEGYAIVQCLGDAVFVPAGAPHQVRNLHNCIKVAEDFVSPENVSHCFHLTQEFRALSESHMNREDKLQIKNIIYHAVKDSLTVLARTKEEALAKHKAANNEVKVKEET